MQRTTTLTDRLAAIIDDETTAPDVDDTPRKYVRIRPTDERLSADRITTHLRRLADLDVTPETDTDTTPWYRTLLDAPTPPTVECLLVSHVDEPTIEYLFGIAGDHESDQAFETLDSTLRGLFPDAYEFAETTRTPDEIVPSDVVPTPAPDEDQSTTDTEPPALASTDPETDDPLSPGTAREREGLVAIDEADDTAIGPHVAAPTDVTAGDHALTDTANPHLDQPPTVATVEFQGVAQRRDDWQTSLAPFETFLADDGSRVPLTTVGEAMADASVSMVYQALFRPKPDWSAEAELRRNRLEDGLDTLGQRVLGTAFDSIRTTTDESDDAPSAMARERLDALDATNPRRSFDVNARLVAYRPPDAATDDAAGTDPVPEIDRLAAAFAHASGDYYRIAGRVETGVDARPTIEQLRTRTLRAPTYDRLATRLPWTDNDSPGIVADADALPAFCLLTGDGLTPTAHRAFAPTPGERTALPRPPTAELATYRTPGLTLGRPLTEDDATAADPLALPPTLQPLHVAWFGKTGSGKSTSLVNAILDNAETTDGADVLIDPKGDGMPVEYLRAHYARHGDLERVYYFDCTEVLPALSFFDIRDQLDAGVDRTTAVEDVVDHYIEILVGIMGRDRFEQAVRSPDIIRYLVKALFDPVHGSDAFTHRDLQGAARRMHETRDAPPVTDPDLEAMLGGVAANSKRSFDELMQGVANRIEKIPLDDRLGQLFNHSPEPADTHFDFREYLDEDAVVIFDTGGLRTESQRVLTLVLLSNLWTALRRRARDGDDADRPLVNLYLEEAASVATSGLMTDLLAQSRSFGLSVTLAMQFPAQLRQADNEAYAELLNNVSTLVTGNVALDRDLAERLATDDMTRTAVGNRLRALRRGEWLVSLPAPFAEPEPRPFLVESAPLPRGHPDAEPLSDALATSFEAMLGVVEDRTRRECGLDVTPPTSADAPPDRPTAASQADADAETRDRVNSTLPYTKRLPRCIEYDEDAHALVCGNCETRYDPTRDGMARAIQCCHDLDRVDREEIPICDINLKLSPSERAASDYSDRQLCFLQAVYTAHQRRYDAELEYDLLTDSMVRLQEYVGVEAEDVQGLLDDDLLAQDCNHPHRLYTVTPAGREEIQVGHREGIAHGDGRGDLSESSLHVVMVELGRRYVERAYVDNPDSPVENAVSYHEVGEHRLDAAGLDGDGEVVVTVEAERSNNDTLRAVPEDYDKMAACEPADAIWIVKNREMAHDVLDALNDPPTGPVRVEKTYSRNSPPQAFNIDEAGLTEMHTVRYVRDTLLE